MTNGPRAGTLGRSPARFWSRRGTFRWNAVNLVDPALMVKAAPHNRGALWRSLGVVSVRQTRSRCRQNRSQIHETPYLSFFARIAALQLASFSRRMLLGPRGLWVTSYRIAFVRLRKG